jgi:TIR domain
MVERDYTVVKAFLSYHHRARKIAGRSKAFLSGYGVDAFLAHEDLEPADEWQKEILQALERCDVFIPLLTKSFPLSDWTDQETGIAVARKKFILPVKFSIVPYGFIGKFQALKARKNLDETCRRIALKIASRPAFKETVTERVITAFLESGSFEESTLRAEALVEFAPYSIGQLNRIVEGGAKNSQIYGGRVARECLRKLIEEGGSRIRRKLVRSFEKRVKSWPY